MNALGRCGGLVVLVLVAAVGAATAGPPPEPGAASQARFNQAVLLHARGEFASAVPLFQAAVADWDRECGPSSPRPWQARVSLGFALLRAGRPLEALPLFQAVLAAPGAAATTRTDALRGLARCADAQGEDAAACRWYEAAVDALEAQSPRPRRTLADELERWAAALRRRAPAVRWLGLAEARDDGEAERLTTYAAYLRKACASLDTSTSR